MTARRAFRTAWPLRAAAAARHTPVRGERAVVDAQLRVRDIATLRVADASVMPSVVVAYTNVTLLASAERAASIVIDG